jgi:regulator of protease activity HflC (stomatin/prohibitin superfamily)
MKTLKISGAVLGMLLALVALFGTASYGLQVSNDLRNEANTFVNNIGYATFFATVVLFFTGIFIISKLFTQQMKNIFSKGFGLVFLLLLSSQFMTGCVEAIDAGNVGIKFDRAGDNRGVSNIVQVSGWVWYTPLLSRVEEFPTFTQTKVYDEFEVNSQDGTPFKVDPTLNYYAQADKVPQIYTQFRKTLPEIADGFIKTSIFESYRVVTNNYQSNVLIGNRNRYEAQVRDTLISKLKPYGFVVQQLTTKLVPPQSLTDAINAKNEAVQVALQIGNKVASARAQAKIDSTQAQGRSQALRIEADARAYANRQTQQTLTPLLIQQQWIQKWKGDVATHQLGGSNTMFTIPIK